MIIYTENEADQLIENGYVFRWQDAINFPLNEFLSRFFARRGYKDGLHGLALSILMAFYHFVVFLNIWEKRKFKELDTEKSFLEMTGREFKNMNQKISFWLLSEKINSIKNPIKKNYYRLWKYLRLIP